MSNVVSNNYCCSQNNDGKYFYCSVFNINLKHVAIHEKKILRKSYIQPLTIKNTKKNNFYTQDVNYNMEQYTESIHKK